MAIDPTIGMLERRIALRKAEAEQLREERKAALADLERCGALLTEREQRIGVLEGELRDYEQSMTKANARIRELEAANKELHDVLADHGSPDGDEQAARRQRGDASCPLCADRGYVPDPRFPGSARVVWCSCPAARTVIAAFGASAYATPEEYFAGKLAVASREPEYVGYDPAEESLADRAERRADAVLEPDGSERGRR